MTFDWSLLLQTVVGSGVGASAVGLLFKQHFDHKLEIQKALLNRESQIHGRQVDTLMKLHEHLEKAKAYLQLMASRVRFDGEKPEEYPGLFINALNAARDEFVAGRLLIPLQVIAQLDDLLNKLWEGRNELAWANLPMSIDGNVRAQFWDRATAIAYDEIPKLLHQIEIDGRKIIYGAHVE